MKDEELGKIAYEAYCATTDFKSAITGDPLPQWDDQSEVIKNAWIAAGNAVAHFVQDDANEDERARD